jgi:23S rRNA (adenine2503-C2)-methyltransferase
MTLNLMDYDPNDLKALFTGMGQPAYRASQVFRAIVAGADDLNGITGLPAALRTEMADAGYHIGRLTIIRKLVSKTDGTVKFALALRDGNIIESVVMKYEYGTSVCVSSQAGCKMGCAFCASTGLGFTRDLSPGEMLDQVMLAGRETGGRISNVVVMGIGEPLDNYGNLLKFLRLLNHPDGLNIGMRHVTVSTCGLVEKIDQLAEENLQLTLSISLHAPDDAIREKIMPIGKKYPVEAVIRAAENYAAKTGRRITFEYALISGINDSPAQAAELCAKIKGMLCHVNVIPMNEIDGSVFEKSSAKATAAFMAVLSEHGVEATLRRELGSDIKASCGQLRRNESFR